ncbi:PhnE/PtxC family ABC transporter permease [Pseudomonas syringae]|uniref:PhnE/PtxC family ABC transporter permease n=1 Tax=Pseudomonas syringae TaxID=317 RepID=UPI00200ACE8B|nr:ABC transporter permease [Pseudomonas syringae]MCK9708565.1 ABC transporter permease [Pseudomonas syringae pv. syringae]
MLSRDQRDPAATPRLLLTLLAVALLWPGIRLAELNPLVLLQADNARTMGSFLSGFWPVAHSVEFLGLLLDATLQTLAIATAGVLAIAITYAGMLGKVYAEIFESVDQRPAHALLQAGSGRLAALAYGILPNAAAELTSYTVYRWECAVRASVVMGFVGAGGLGQQIDLSMRMFAGDEVASMLLTFLLLVLLADQLSRLLRRQFT